jgi:hypothetical protein
MSQRMDGALLTAATTSPLETQLQLTGDKRVQLLPLRTKEDADHAGLSQRLVLPKVSMLSQPASWYLSQNSN